MLVSYKPSRALNDNRGLFGLESSDFGAAIIVFVSSSVVLDGHTYALVALPVALLILVALAPLRLLTRRRILRDLGFYFFTSPFIRVRKGGS